MRKVFRQEPSPELSYVRGANIGDGCTLIDNWIVKLEVTDRDFAEAFNTSMAALFSRKTPNKILTKRFKVKRLPMYVVRYACRPLVELLRLPLEKILEIAFKFPREFLRGFFDAEGHVDVGITKYLFLSVGAENTSKALEWSETNSQDCVEYRFSNRPEAQGWVSHGHKRCDVRKEANFTQSRP